jgi:subtilisin family serine protease
MRRLLAALLLALAGCLAQSLAAQDTAAPAPQASEAAEGGKILVMLKMPAAHFRPGARYSGSYDDKAAQSARRRVAARIARENDLELLEGWPMPLVGVDCYVMRVRSGQPLEAVIEHVSRYREVAWSQPLQDYHTLGSPRAAADPLFPAQPAASEWHLAELHRLVTGKGVTVAIIDSKIETMHPDLSGQVTVSQDFLSAKPSPPEDHGTGVAGVIGAKPDNGIGIVGVAPGARLMALRACSEARGGVSTCDTLSLAKALQFALERGADVINMSLSGPPDRLLSTLIGVGLSRRVSVVAAYDPRRAGGGFPASVPGVVAVADEALPSVPEPVFRAPGKDIPTTQPGGRWYLVNGSSFAAAHVTGLLALLREERRTNARLGAIARAPGGIVDACATLVTVTRGCNCACAVEASLAHRGR